ncbi:hypothetical protein [Sorangium sp. So ce131]|uniref:hypothetical protein n=1 Tax=Sorangium sp. So ce131 TaxID=3133282 RepID=UPI003F63CE56
MAPDKISAAVMSRLVRLVSEEEGRREGRIEGKQEALLVILTARGLPPTDQERAQITSCTRGADLDRWIVRAATASSTSEVLAPARSRPARGSPSTTRSHSPEHTSRTRKTTRSRKPSR